LVKRNLKDSGNRQRAFLRKNHHASDHDELVDQQDDEYNYKGLRCRLYQVTDRFFSVSSVIYLDSFTAIRCDGLIVSLQVAFSVAAESDPHCLLRSLSCQANYRIKGPSAFVHASVPPRPRSRAG
jgi:hypothetical protein